MITASFFYRLSFWSMSCWLLTGIPVSHAQEEASVAASTGQAEMSLRKSVLSREFRGRRFIGEERRIGPGDSLWRILVEEKGLPERRFHSYLVAIRGLNPQIGNLGVLRVGDRIFIPLRFDNLAPVADARAEQVQTSSGKTYNYRVRPGEHLYRILREQLKLSDQVKLAEYYALVKDLNPKRRNWDNLVEGEVIRLPAMESNFATAKSESALSKLQGRKDESVLAAAEPESSLPGSTKEPSTSIPARREPPIRRQGTVKAAEAIRLPARDHIQILAKVAEALGNKVQRNGEEVVALPEGTIRLDKSTYPVVYSAALGQRVVLDPDGRIPVSLKAKLSDPSIATPVLAMANGLSVHEAVAELLASLGYQLLTTEKPIVVHQAGVAFEAKGDWMALAPEVSNQTQQILIIDLADSATAIPDYLKSALAKRGLSLYQIVLTDAVAEIGKVRTSKALQNRSLAPTVWPRDRREIIDALLLSFGVAFGVAEDISVELHDGLRVDRRVDRLFEWSGIHTAIFFQPLDPAISQALRDKHGIRPVVLDVDTLSSRDIIAQVLGLLGNQTTYGEHRFAAATSAPDRLTLKAWGFHIPQKGMFVTDRQIPPGLHRFFFERGLDIVYFR